MSTNQATINEHVEQTLSDHQIELYGSPGKTHEGMVMIVNNHTKQLDRILSIFRYAYYMVIATVIGVVIKAIVESIDWMK